MSLALIAAQSHTSNISDLAVGASCILKMPKYMLWECVSVREEEEVYRLCVVCVCEERGWAREIVYIYYVYVYFVYLISFFFVRYLFIHFVYFIYFVYYIYVCLSVCLFISRHIPATLW